MKLPTDEEITTEATYLFGKSSGGPIKGFQEGCDWVLNLLAPEIERLEARVKDLERYLPTCISCGAVHERMPSDYCETCYEDVFGEVK